LIIIDENNEVSEWFTQLELDGVGSTRVDIQTFEVANGLETELILIQDTVYNQLSPILSDKMSQTSAVILFMSIGQHTERFASNVVGEISIATSKQLVKNFIFYLEDQIKSQTILKSQLMTLNNELMETMEGISLNLERVKRTYERITPKRLESFKGMTVYSKYAAGEDMGGEFFDLFSDEGKVFIFMSSTSSYLASSSIIQFFSELKSVGVINLSTELGFIKKIKNDLQILNQEREKPVKAELLTGILDMKTMKLSGHLLGGFEVMSSSLQRRVDVNSSLLEGSPEKSFFEIQLVRGERVLFNSPGFIHNWDSQSPEFLIEELLSNPKIKVLNILDEIYFQLKKESENGFLTHDASSIIMEVQENVVHKV
jgi:hypothetical protein